MTPMRWRAGTGPALALVFNAAVWGLSWWPLRELAQAGVHPLWATALVYALSCVVIAAWRPAALFEVLRSPALWVIVLAAGGTNAAFNWAVTVGDVVRVVLLFYLMPLWTLLLARVLLGERVHAAGALRVALGLLGAAIVLWPAQGGWPLPTHPAEWLGLVGGLCFALNNVMLRRQAGSSAPARALAMFLGGVLVAGGLAALLTLGGTLSAPPALGWQWTPLALVLALLFLVSNFALQHGASRLPAQVTAVLMLTEVVFASVSAIALGAGLLDWRVAVGGALIALAALLAARRAG